MSSFRLIYLLLMALPDILKLLRTLDDANKSKEAEDKSRKDIHEISEAFRTRDPDRLKRVFNQADTN
jgi:hypothetical protein